MLEKMNDFFNNRTDTYDEHMLVDIEDAREFYPFTASLLPQKEKARVLDLGCGTGLELGYYFKLNQTAKITGIDLSNEMLRLLSEKFSDKDLTIINDSYFEVPLGENIYDAAVSVESLHHFEKDEKIKLYKKVYESLVPGGMFVLTDYFAQSNEEEQFFRDEFIRLKEEQGISDGELYHYDTPLTAEHECEVLKQSGFEKVEILGKWASTYTIRASK